MKNDVHLALHFITQATDQFTTLSKVWSQKWVLALWTNLISYIGTMDKEKGNTIWFIIQLAGFNLWIQKTLKVVGPRGKGT